MNILRTTSLGSNFTGSYWKKSASDVVLVYRCYLFRYICHISDCVIN